MSKASWLQIGVVGRAHGLRGHFFVSGRKQELPENFPEVVIGEEPEKGKRCKVLENREQNNGSVLLCEGFTHRDANQEFMGQPIWVKRSSVAHDKEKEFFWADLIGKRVVDKNGKKVGDIKEISNHGASDVVSVINEKREELSIAMVKDYFDMHFSAHADELKLVVDQDLFTDLWQKAK